MPIDIKRVTPIHFNNKTDSTQNYVTNSNGTRKYYDVCTLSLPQPIVLSNCEVKLETLAIYNSWSTISAANNNNTFSIIYDTVPLNPAGTTSSQIIFTITLPDGTYEYTDINQALFDAQVEYGLYCYACGPPETTSGAASVTDDIVVPLSLEVIPTQYSVRLTCSPWGLPRELGPLQFSTNTAGGSPFYGYITASGWANSNFPSETTIATYYQTNQPQNLVCSNTTAVTSANFATLTTPCTNSNIPRFRIPSGFGVIIGFPAGDYPSSLPTGPYSMFYNSNTDPIEILSSLPPQISKYPTINIGCNLIQEVVNPYYPDILYTIAPNVPPGDLVQSINLATFRQAQNGTYAEIIIRLYDENNDPLPITDPNRSYTITVQPVESSNHSIEGSGNFDDSIGYTGSMDESPKLIAEQTDQINFQGLKNVRGDQPTFPLEPKYMQPKRKPISSVPPVQVVGSGLTTQNLVPQINNPFMKRTRF